MRPGARRSRASAPSCASSISGGRGSPRRPRARNGARPGALRGGTQRLSVDALAWHARGARPGPRRARRQRATHVTHARRRAEGQVVEQLVRGGATAHAARARVRRRARVPVHTRRVCVRCWRRGARQRRVRQSRRCADGDASHGAVARTPDSPARSVPDPKIAPRRGGRHARGTPSAARRSLVRPRGAARATHLPPTERAAPGRPPGCGDGSRRRAPAWRRVACRRQLRAKAPAARARPRRRKRPPMRAAWVAAAAARRGGAAAGSAARPHAAHAQRARRGVRRRCAARATRRRSLRRRPYAGAGGAAARRRRRGADAARGSMRTQRDGGDAPPREAACAVRRHAPDERRAATPPRRARHRRARARGQRRSRRGAPRPLGRASWPAHARRRRRSGRARGVARRRQGGRVAVPARPRALQPRAATAGADVAPRIARGDVDARRAARRVTAPTRTTRVAAAGARRATRRRLARGAASLGARRAGAAARAAAARARGAARARAAGREARGAPRGRALARRATMRDCAQAGRRRATRGRAALRARAAAAPRHDACVACETRRDRRPALSARASLRRRAAAPLPRGRAEPPLGGT